MGVFCLGALPEATVLMFITTGGMADIRSRLFRVYMLMIDGMRF
jgi:hypothetical protein